MTATHFQFKKAYPVFNRDSFLKYFLEQRTGIRYDGKLRRCYKGIESDIEDLIRDGWVTVIQTSDMNSRKEVKNKSVLFPRNKLDSEVEREYCTPCKSYL